MDKFFSSTYHSGINPNKNFSGFSSMIATSPKQTPKEPSNSYKQYQERHLASKTFTFKKESSRPPSFLSTN